MIDNPVRSEAMTRVAERRFRTYDMGIAVLVALSSVERLSGESIEGVTWCFDELLKPRLAAAEKRHHDHRTVTRVAAV